MFVCFTFLHPIYTFFLAGNVIVYTPSQDKNKEKYFHDWKSTIKKQLFIPFPPS